jgi:hypothetical protein
MKKLIWKGYTLDEKTGAHTASWYVRPSILPVVGIATAAITLGLCIWIG